VCTNADLPYCEFEDTYASSSNLPLTDRIHCSRSQFGTDCEERHFPVGGENQALQSQVLKFRCGGDPVECWLIGGNATWETTLERRVSGGSGQSYSCKPGKKSPEPAPQQVPGPDTVRRGTFTTANG